MRTQAVDAARLCQDGGLVIMIDAAQSFSRCTQTVSCKLAFKRNNILLQVRLFQFFLFHVKAI